jgi:hypothetical protein
MSRLLARCAAIVVLAGCRDSSRPSQAFRAEADAELNRFTPAGAIGGATTFSQSTTSGAVTATRELEFDRGWEAAATALTERCAQGSGKPHREGPWCSCTSHKAREMWTVSISPISSTTSRFRLELKVLPD